MGFNFNPNLTTYSQNFQNGGSAPLSTGVQISPYSGAAGFNTPSTTGGTAGGNNGSGFSWEALAGITGNATDIAAMLLGKDRASQQNDVLQMQLAQDAQRKQTQNIIFMGLGAIALTAIVIIIIKYAK